MLRRAIGKLGGSSWKHPPVRMSEGVPSAGGELSANWWKARIPIMTFFAQDPMAAELLFRRSLVFVYDVPTYNYIFFAVFGAGFCAGIVLRHFLFNPDVMFKRQELKKPFPDRHRQYTYSVPYYNSAARNYAAKWRATFIDNEPDYMDHHPLGLRPDRKQTHRRMPGVCFSIPRYFAEDPLSASCSHANIGKLYKDLGYSTL